MNLFDPRRVRWWLRWLITLCALIVVAGALWSQPAPREAAPADAKSSYDQIAPVLLGKGSFEQVIAKDKDAKAAVMERQQKLLEERYDLTPRPDPNVKMTRGKPIPVGPTTWPPQGMTWEKLAALSPDEVREKALFPKGFLPLPHVKHEVGGQVYPQMVTVHR